MTRVLGRLSAVRVQSVRERGYYGDGGGLYLRVAPRGAKGWIFRYGGGGPRAGRGVWAGGPEWGWAVTPPLASPRRANWRATAAACLPPASTPSRCATRSARRLLSRPQRR